MLFRYTQIWLLFSLSFLLYSCQVNPYRTAISIELIPESDAGDYALVWKDTLGKAKQRDLQTFLMDREQELHCYIFNNKKDTLGYYIGRSMPGQWTYFQTKPPTDSLIHISFRVGINHFSSILATYTDKEIKQFNRSNRKAIQFESVDVRLDTALRTPYNLILVEEKKKGLR